MTISSRKVGFGVGAVCAAMSLSSCQNSASQIGSVSSSEMAWTPTNKDREMSDALNGFGFHVLKKLDAQKSPDENVLFSPFSISTALTLVEQGAAGKTRSEMEALLQPSGFAAQDVLDSSAALTRGWQTADAKVQVDIANSVWLNNKCTLKPTFVQMAKTNFDAQTATLDFSSSASAKAINSWISGKTHGKIAGMVSSESLQKQILLVANAVYFHGTWQSPFDKAATQDDDFHLASGKKWRVPMMSLHTERTFSYARNGKVALLGLPYANGALSMVFLLPAQGISLSQIVAQIDNAQWKTWMETMKVREGNAQIPRFTLKRDRPLELVPTLQKLGMNAAFSSGSDFSPMTTVRPVWISAVNHKAWMQVDETGTEAAASTTVHMAGAAQPAPAVPPFEFIANRPFLAAIRDNRSGNLLFLAEVNRPSS